MQVREDRQRVVIGAEHLRPNTPDILSEYLQHGGMAAIMVRAATLGVNYGIYGPAFELCVNQAKEASSEENLESKKCDVRRGPRSICFKFG